MLYLDPPCRVSLPLGHSHRPASSAPTFRRRLLRWFRRHGRDLPWRRTRDPYHILVSEFMLQQTQVSRVEAYYHRFLERYPTVEALAAARPRLVRESWDGLGYYRRAANLHRLAQDGGGASTAASSRRIRPSCVDLPGVGRYTAGAVASFAYERADAGRRYQRRAGAPARVPPATRRQRGRSGGSGRPAQRSCRGAGKRPGPSIRRSWSWARWSAPPGWRDAASARCGARARRDGGER